MALRQKLGNAFDRVGTALHLPELGLSESTSGGATANTGDKALLGTNAFYDPTRNIWVTDQTPLTQNGTQLGAALSASGYGASPTTTALASVPDPFEADLQGLSSADTSSGSGSTPDGSYVPEYRTVQGDPTRYDINDPVQAKAYFDKRLALAEQLRQQGLADLHDTEASKLHAAAQDYADKAATLDERLKAVDQGEADYARNYDNRVDAFGKGYSSAQAKRQNAFAGANGFQSAQGDSERLAYGQYQNGLSDLAAEKTSNQNAFATQRGGLTRQKSNLADTYNTYQSDLAREIGAKETSLGNSVNDFKSSTASELAPFDYASGISDYKDRYQLEPYDPVATQTSDLSKYGAATSFSGVQGQSGATAANPFANLGSTQSPLEQYLDVNKDKKQKDPMKQYLYA